MVGMHYFHNVKLHKLIYNQENLWLSIVRLHKEEMCVALLVLKHHTKGPLSTLLGAPQPKVLEKHRISLMESLSTKDK